MYEKKVAELFEKGLDESSFGYHGTSIEAVQKLADTGKLPNGGRHPGRLYIAPMNAEAAVFTPRQSAESYANWNAKKHFILPHLPFEPATEDVEALSEYCSVNMGGKMREIDYKMHDKKGEIRRLISKCEKGGLSEDALVKLRREAKNRKGVIIALSASLPKGFKPNTQKGVPNECYIDTPEGLPIEYITGIEPLGQHEWDVLMEMQRGLE
jgi:hypothetical protein